MYTASFAEYTGNTQNFNFRDSCHVLLPEAVYTYSELGRIRGNTQNFDFRDSCHVLLPEAVYTQRALRNTREISEILIFEIVVTYFYPKLYTHSELGRIRGNTQNFNFRDSCHVLLSEAVYTYSELGRIRGKYPKIIQRELCELRWRYAHPCS